MRESVIYQDILQQGKKQGKESWILRQINRRFGEIDTPLIEQVRNLSTDELEDLGEALFDFSEVGDLEVWLNQRN
jgi:predicted transposase YdaD